MSQLHALFEWASVLIPLSLYPIWPPPAPAEVECRWAVGTVRWGLRRWASAAVRTGVL